MIDQEPDSIQLYLTVSEKALFKAACRRRRTTMSREIRKFCAAYVNTIDTYDRVKYFAVEVERRSSGKK